MKLKDIYVIIVLYKTSLENSNTIKSLSENFQSELNLMVYDNSPECQYFENEFVFKQFNIKYYHNASNPGLSYAYNIALKNASLLDSTWLMLLDQDTNITYEYFKQIINLEINKFSNNIVAIIPNVVSKIDNQMISPNKVFLGGLFRPIFLNPGIIDVKISGINSGTILNVSFMNSINGFSTKYTLDMLDHWYFRKIMQLGKKVYLLDCKIQQDLSVYGNFEENISFVRYRQLLNAEYTFIKDCGFLNVVIFKLRMLLRVLKFVKFRNREYYRFTLHKIFSFNL
jgi:GT2 family glycosyltransferase